MVTATPGKSPAQRLLDQMGPVDRFHDHEKNGDFGMPSRNSLEDMLAPHSSQTGVAHQHLGPLKKVHAFWFAGMSCDGCTVSVTGTDRPPHAPTG